MRLTTLIIGLQACFATMLLASTTNAQSISLNIKNSNIEQVFITIEKQANVSFVYDKQMLSGIPSLSIKATNKSLNEILKEIASKVPLQFKQVGSLISVSRLPLKPYLKEPIPGKTSVNNLSPITISGKVTDERGNPLDGVTVRVKETSKTTATDTKGNYSVTTDGNNTLIFSYVGFKKAEIPIEGQTEIDLKLAEINSDLDEVQIIAYGSTTQRLTTGSISKVGAEDIENQPVSDPMAALEGRVPGLEITQSNGVPGSAFKVLLRGQNALSTDQTGNSTPLFIIDGVPFAPGNTAMNQINSAAGINGLSPFNSINPNDIESIEVLKDADATAIYGSRGAYGVILITTKKGKAGRTQVVASVSSGISTVTRTMDLLNTPQYLQLRQEAFKNDGVTPTVDNAPDLLVFNQNSYTDWKKLLIGNTAHATDAEASISGGDENTQFIIDGGYHYQTTVLPGDFGDSRASVHFNLNHSSTNKKFNVSLTANYSSDDNNILVSDLTNFINLPPNYPTLLDGNGNPIWEYKGVSLTNPLAYLKDSYNALTENLTSNLQLSYKLFDGLTLRSSLGYNFVQLNEVATYPSTSSDPQGNPMGSSEFGNNLFNSWIIEPQAEYVKNIMKGKLDVLVGGSWQQTLNNSSYLQGTDYTSDNLLKSISSAGSLTASNNYDQYRYEAVFGRVSYNWQDKYIVNLSGRRDGSSRFGPGKQFGNFGAAGAAWLFSNEDFIKNNVPFLSFGKLRSSYGITGSDNIGDYQYLDSWTSTQYPYQNISGLRPTLLANPDYSWEVNKKLEVGADLGFLKDRILFSADYYYDRSSNHLVSYALPTQTGFNSITANFPAVVQNTGWEFSLNTKNVVSKNFSWSSSFNLTIPKNKLVSFPDLATSSYADAYKVGQSLNVYQGLQYLGVNPTTGVFQFKDQNGDGALDYNDEKVLGNLDPKFYGGLQNTFNYKSLSLQFFFEFRKQMGINYLESIYANGNVPGMMFNEPTAILSRWQNPGDNTNIQKVSATAGTDAYNAAAILGGGYNSAVFSDASFIRLKNLSLSYKLPDTWTKRLHVVSSQIYLQGQNILTITDYKGGDPETQNYFTLPPLKTWVIGIRLTL